MVVTLKEIAETLLTDDEQVTLLEQLANGQPGGFTERDAATLISWARKARFANALVDIALQKKLLFVVNGKKVSFKRAEAVKQWG